MSIEKVTISNSFQNVLEYFIDDAFDAVPVNTYKVDYSYCDISKKVFKVSPPATYCALLPHLRPQNCLDINQ